MIREARIEDAAELMKIQKNCIAGTNLMVTTVNEPDFFLRSSLYLDTKTFVSVDEDTGAIQGTVSVSIKKATIKGHEIQQGYVYQLFTNALYQRKGVARQLLQHIDHYMLERNVDIATLLILEKNYPSMHLFESKGYHLTRTFANPYLSIYKNIKVNQEKYEIRTMREDDLGKVCNLLNKMWKGSDFYIDYTRDSLKKEILRTPGLSYDSIYLLLEHNKLCACIGLWNWSYITKVTVIKLSFKYRLLRSLVKSFGHLIKLPQIPGPGEELKQACLYFYGYSEVEYFTQLLASVNNNLRNSNISEICLLCEKNDVIRPSFRKFFSVSIDSQLYTKKFNKNIPDLGERIWINGSDI